MCTINYGEFKLLPPKIDCEEEEFSKGAFKQLLEFFKNEQLCDVELIAGEDGASVAAHRVVLSASSLYFTTMFMGSLPETDRQVTIGEVKGSVLKKLVRYCYTGALQLEEATVDELLAAASLLQITRVEKLCCDFLEERINKDNWVELYKLGDRYNYKDLLDKAENFGCTFFSNVCRYNTFLELDAELLGRLLASDRVNVESEETVFHAVIAWVKHDVCNRKKQTMELLTHVRMPRTRVLEAMRRLALIEDPVFPPNAPVTYGPRVSTSQCLLVMGGVDGVDFIQKYCPILDNWDKWDVKPYKCSNIGGASLLGETIVICDGAISTSDQSWLLNVKSKTIEVDVATFNEERCFFGMATVGDFTYVIGGLNGTNCLNSVERLSLSSRLWSFVCPMLAPRENLRAAVLDGCIYVVGGYDNHRIPLRSMEVYDPNENTWTLRAPLNRDCTNFGFAAGDGFLYIVGGHDGDNSTNVVERYDPKTDCWTLLASLPNARWNLSCAFVNNRLLAIGGFNNIRCRDVDEYDPAANKWTSKAPLTEGRTSPEVMVVQHRLAVYSTAPQMLESFYVDLKAKYRKAVQTDTLDALVDESLRRHRERLNNPPIELFPQ